jgi:hypothetical protein
MDKQNAPELAAEHAGHCNVFKQPTVLSQKIRHSAVMPF